MEKWNNSILTKLNVSIHRIYGQIQSSIMTFGINKSYYISIVIGLLTILKLVVQGSLDGWNTLGYDINILWPFVATIASTGYATASSIINYKDSCHNYSIIQDSFYKNKVINNLFLSERQVLNGYKIWSFNNGFSEEKYIMSEKINYKLIEDQKNNETLKMNNLNYKFQLVEEIKKYVPTLLRRNLMSNRLVFNGKLLRMASDLYLDSKSVNVQSVRYFEGQCTNEAVYKKIKSNYSLKPLFLGECLLIDEENILLDLEHSFCANYIGASTIVVTRDNHIIIGKQGDFSRANAGRYAPSGSGSVDYNDIKSSKDFNSLIIKAMEREFCEENNYMIEDYNKINTIIIGYVRLLERGGKPDFFGITFIDEDSCNLENEIKKRELGIQEENYMLPVFEELSIGETLLEFCNKNIAEKNISIQLMILAELIQRYEKELLYCKIS